MPEVLDPRAPWITVTRATAPCWWLAHFEFRNAEESGDDVNTYIVVADEQGYSDKRDPSGKWLLPINPLNAVVVLVRNGGDTELATNRNADGQHHGEVDFNKTAESSFDPSKNQVGAYTVFVQDKKTGNLPSDSVGKMGLPLRRHVSETLMFQRLLTAPEPEPTFTANPATIADGQSSTLAWDATGAQSVKGLGGDTLPLVGSRVVTPTLSTLYGIDVLKQDGSVEHLNVSVTVTDAPPPPPPPIGTTDLWEAAKPIVDTLPPAQFVSLVVAGRTYQLQRTAEGGLFACDARGALYLLRASDLAKLLKGEDPLA